MRVKIRGEHFQETLAKEERIHLSRITSNSRFFHKSQHPKKKKKAPCKKKTSRLALVLRSAGFAFCHENER